MISFVKNRIVNTKPINKKQFENLLLDGKEAYDLLAPVSKLTGNRENPLRLLQALADNPEKSRALNSILQELPVIASKEGISNDDMIAFMQQEFCTGTPYENEKWIETLDVISEDIFNSLGINKDAEQQSKETISFEGTETPNAE